MNRVQKRFKKVIVFAMLICMLCINSYEVAFANANITYVNALVGATTDVNAMTGQVGESKTQNDGSEEAELEEPALNETTEGIDEGDSGETTEGIDEGGADETTDGTDEGNSDQTTDGIDEGGSDETADGIDEGSSDETTDDTDEEVLEEELDEVADETETTMSALSLLGGGTEADPYQIGQAEDFDLIDGNSGAYFQLMNDIDFEGEAFETIDYFWGFFDGGGFTLKNMVIGDETYDGLFGYTEFATFKDLVIEEAHINQQEGAEKLYSGIMVGYSNYSTFENIKIIDCSIKAGEYSGGLVGKSVETVISNCFVEGTVSGTGYVGGLVGSAVSSPISQSYAAATVTGGDYVGGLVGNAAGTSVTTMNISESYALVEVTGNNYVGGLIGNAVYATVKNCFALGSVESLNSSIDVGGLIGMINNRTYVSDCYVAVTVSESAQAFICYRGISYTDLGKNFSGIFYDTTVESSQFDEIAARKMTPAMFREATYKDSNLNVNWDFDNVWAIREGASYPYLRNVAEPDWVEVDRGYWPEGTGTADDPYLISRAEHFRFIKMDDGASYRLANDIDFGGEVFETIDYFWGVFDGGGFTLKNMVIDDETYDGLFGYTEFATFKDLVIEDAHIIQQEGAEKLYSGIMVGYSLYTTFENIKIIDCNIKAGEYSGGLVGHSSSDTITNCSVSGMSTVDGSANVGGLVGSATSSTISQSYATATVTGGDYVGGLVGNAAGTSVITMKISESYALGEITGNTYVGGLIGNAAYATVKDCFVRGSVDAPNGRLLTGGLIGMINNKTYVSNCYVAATISDGADALLCYDYRSDTGIFVRVSNLYYDYSMADNVYNEVATGKFTPEMFRSTTFGNWDFETVWATDAEGSYPYLRNLGEPVWPEADRGNWPEGQGTIEHPYLLSTPEDFAFIDSDPRAYYELKNDIDFERGAVAPLSYFGGNLDGKGYALKNIRMVQGPNTGIFNQMDSATVKNLSIESAEITWTDSAASLGILAGSGWDSTIDKVTVTSSLVDGQNNVGGLLGYAWGCIITNSSISGSIVRGNSAVGGLVGMSDDTSIVDSFARTNVTSTTNSINTGGLAGRSGSRTQIQNCYAAGTVSTGGSGIIPA
ncbi:MAG: hypothetical protein LBV33_06090, partial [Lachnospiraceae bacterium]|nr:hypothetical protein [Lachnospiraceae bacterium]